MRYRDWGNGRHTKAFRDRCKSVWKAVKLDNKVVKNISAKLNILNSNNSVTLTPSCLQMKEVYLYPQFDPIPHAPFPEYLDYAPYVK